MATMTTYERAMQIYQILIGAAHNRQVLTYDLLGDMIGVPARGLGPHLDHLMRYCASSPETILRIPQKPHSSRAGSLKDEDDNG